MTTAISASVSSRPTIAAILAVSAAATFFLFWLIYVHPAADIGNARYVFLPALNAIFNDLAATSLLTGYTFPLSAGVITYFAPRAAKLLGA